MSVTPIRFNINHWVRVRLTTEGKRIISEKRLATFPPRDMFKTKEEDEEGWSKWQLHELMLTFGDRMYPGAEMPFDGNILFEKEAQ